MKKVALSLAGVLAAAAFAPEASALPVFARQTGMACNACHFQHFPILNGFGRAFKASGFTLMGAQGKVEGDELSLPDRLNMAILTTAGIEEQNGGATATGNHNMIQVPGNGGELSLFFGGRISENAGFLSEVGLAGPAGMTAAKLPMMYEIGGGIHAGLALFTTDGQGPSYGFELLSTGATAIHLATAMPGIAPQGHFQAASAHQYIGTGTGGAAGASIVVANPDMFFVNIGKVALDSAAVVAQLALLPGAPASVNNIGGAPSNALNALYTRAAFIFDAAGFNMAAGVQVVGGADALNLSTASAQIIDFQMMGDVGSMNMLVTASYGTAAKTDAAAALNGRFNMYNASTTNARTSLNLLASLGVTPHASVLFGIRQAKDGAATNNADNAIQLGATYGLAQNVELSLTHTRQSGSAWNIVAPATTATPGQNLTSLKVEALF